MARFVLTTHDSITQICTDAPDPNSNLTPTSTSSNRAGHASTSTTSSTRRRPSSFGTQCCRSHLMAGACCLSIRSTQSRASSCTARLSGSTPSDRFRSCSSGMVCAGTTCPARRQVLQTMTKCSWKRASSTTKPIRVSSRPMPMKITLLQSPPRCPSVSGGAHQAWRRLSSERHRRMRHRQLPPRHISEIYL